MKHIHVYAAAQMTKQSRVTGSWNYWATTYTDKFNVSLYVAGKLIGLPTVTLHFVKCSLPCNGCISGVQGEYKLNTSNYFLFQNIPKQLNQGENTNGHFW